MSEAGGTEMPTRYLKESICTSKTLDQLSPEEEVLFYRLLVSCDDYGRYYGEPSMILGQCFPRRVGQITVEDISHWLARLEEVGLLTRYDINGDLYLQVVTWASHQNIRASKSKYPEPPNGTLAGAGNCIQTYANVPVSRISDLVTRISDLDNTSADERTCLEELSNIKGYPLNPSADLTYLRKLKAEFPGVDMLEQLRRWAAYKLDKPLDKNSNPRSQLHTWFQKAQEWSEKRSSKSVGAPLRILPKSADDVISKITGVSG